MSRNRNRSHAKIDALLKLAEKCEVIIQSFQGNESPTKELLEAALKANKGKGIQIYNNGQHFGWYRWSASKQKHEQFSINDFDKTDSIGQLEKEVGKLTRVNLDDFLPVIAGRKQV